MNQTMQIPIVNQQYFQSNEEQLYTMPPKKIEKEKVFLWFNHCITVVWIIWFYGHGNVW